MDVNLKSLSTAQLKAIRMIISEGIPANAEISEAATDRKALCNTSPPKGYPTDKSDYGDPACFRYPLNTKSRCMAAWRYVHQASNKSILGKKWDGIVSKIKSYAKSKYKLDLQAGAAESINWEDAFTELYDIPDGEIVEGAIMAEELKLADLEKELATLKEEKDALIKSKTELETKASQVDSLTKEIEAAKAEVATLKKEVEELRNYKKTVEEAAEKAKRIEAVEAKLKTAGIEADVKTEAEYWLSMTEDTITKTIAKMAEISKKASASTKEVKVPNIVETPTDNVEIVREGLKEMKSKGRK
jgi:hypothetical protein